LAEKSVVIKVTDQGLKEVLATAKELEKVLNNIGSKTVGIGGGSGAGAPGKDTSKNTKKNTKATKEGTKANKDYNDSAGKVYNSNRGISGSSGKAGKDMGNMAAGMGGFIHVYATLAAHAFALSAAFEILKGAMDTSTMIRGLEEMGATSGNNLKLMAKDFRDVTGAAVSTAEAMRTVAFASSAGMTGDKIKDLGKVARGAALALGRDVGDAVDRLTRGVVKLEPEILDELGLIVRVDEASRKYAKTIGKKVTELTAYEKQQAFANETIDQGIRKYGELNDKLETNPFNRLASEVADLSFQILELINKGLGPIANFFANNKMALVAGFAVMTTFLAKKAMPALNDFGKTMAEKITKSEAAYADRVKATTAALDRKSAALRKVKEAEASKAKKSLQSSAITAGIALKPDSKSMKDLAKGDAKVYITQMKKRLRLGQKDTKKAFQAFTKQFPNVTKKQFLALRTQMKSYEKAQVKVIKHIEGVWWKSWTGMKKQAVVALASVQQGISRLKQASMSAMGAIGKGLGKVGKIATWILTIMAFVGDYIVEFGEWLGLLNKGSKAVDSAFDTIASNLENATKAQAKYNDFMKAGLSTSSDYIHKHEVIGNLLKDFKSQADDAATALKNFDLGSLSITDLKSNATDIKNLLETYKKLGDAGVNKAIDTALSKNNLNLSTLVANLEKNPDAFANMLKDLGPLLDEQSRKQKNMQGQLESLASTFKSFSDNFKKFGDEFKVKTPFDKMVQDLDIATSKINKLSEDGVLSMTEMLSTIDNMTASARLVVGVDQASLDKAKKEYIAGMEQIAYASSAVIQSIEVEHNKKIAQLVTPEMSKNAQAAGRKQISKLTAEKDSLVSKTVATIAKAYGIVDPVVGAIKKVKEFYAEISLLQTRVRDNKVSLEVSKGRQQDFKLIKDSNLALAGHFELQQSINKLNLDNLATQRQLAVTKLNSMQDSQTPEYKAQKALIANIVRQYNRLAITTSDIRVDLEAWNAESALYLKQVELASKEVSTQIGFKKSLLDISKEDTLVGKIAHQQALGKLDIQKLELSQATTLNKNNRDLVSKRKLELVLAKELVELQAKAPSEGVTKKDLEGQVSHKKSLVKAAQVEVQQAEQLTKVLDARHAAEKEILKLKQKQAMVDASGADDVFKRVKAFQKGISGDSLADDLFAVEAGSIYADQEASTKAIKEYQEIVTDRLKEQTAEYEKHLGLIQAHIDKAKEGPEQLSSGAQEYVVPDNRGTFTEVNSFGTPTVLANTGTATGDAGLNGGLEGTPGAEAQKETMTELNVWLIEENQRTVDIMAMHWESYAEKVGMTQLKGLGKMTSAFQSFSTLGAKQAKRRTKVMGDFEEEYFDKAEGLNFSFEKFEEAKSKKSAKLASAEAQEKLGAAAGMFGGMGDMMEEGSKAQQAFHAIEKAMHLAKMAMMAAEMAQSLAALLPKAAEAAADGAAKDPNPYTKIATGLAIFAAMSALGGGGKSVSTAAPKTQRVSSSATLETPEEKADSLKTALANIEEIEIKAFEQGWDVLYALRSIDDSMTKLSTDIIKGMQALGGIGTFSIGDMETVFGDWFGTTVKPAFLGLFGGKSTTTELMGAGIQIVAQKLADVIDLDAGSWANLELKVWEKIKSTTTKSGFLGFGGGTSSSTTTNWKDFDTDAENSFAKTLFDIGDAVLSLGEDLGYARSALIDNLRDFEIAVQDIDLKDLSPEEQASAVQNALSAIANDITLKMIPAVEQWRYAGEEYLEALSRVYRDMLGFKQAFDRIGLTTGDFLSATGIEDILDWQQNVLKSKKGGFGDIKGLLTSLEKFSKAIYGEGELAKFALDSAKNRVGTGLSELGLAAGTSVDDFRTWYESKLGTGFFDDPDKLATMIRLGEAFGDMTNSADDLKDAFGDIIGLIDEMKYGELSSLTDADKYGHFKTEAEKLAADAMAGNVKAGEKLAETMSSFIDLSKSMFGGVGEFMKDRDWALKMLEDFRALMGFANGGVISGGFRAFASGGIVSNPTMGLIGEGRYNEAVVPLPDGTSIPVLQNNSPMVEELKAFKEQQASLMQVSINTSSQEREEMQDAIIGLKAEIVELRNSNEEFGSSVERMSTSMKYSRA